MCGFKCLFAFMFCLSGVLIHAQDNFFSNGSNYGGLTQVIANPAAASGNLLKIDIVAAGTDFSFNNSWLSVKRTSIFSSKSRESWNNRTPGVPDNIFKNFLYNTQSPTKNLFFEQRLLLPSVMLNPDNKNAFAFTWSYRQLANLDGISRQLAHLFENEFDLSVTQNNRVQNSGFRAIQMGWVEYGFTYARVLKQEGQHLIKAGITPKLLQGVQSNYLFINELDLLFSTKDTLSYLKADFSYARSAGSGRPVSFNARLAEKYKGGHGLQAGLDIGFIYEWRPAGNTDLPDANSSAKIGNAYKLKFGASLVDLGKIRFRKERNYYDLPVSVDQSDIIRYISAGNLRAIDSLLQHDFPANTGKDNFSVMLPTALNLQLDYAFSEHYYLNLSSHLSGFNRSKELRVHNYSAVCLAPRYESYWFGIALPLTFNTLSAQRNEVLMTGINLHAGPLCIGTNDVRFFYRKDIPALHFYALLKLSIPHNTLTKNSGRSWTDKYKSKR